MISYNLSIENYSSHFIDIEMTIDKIKEKELTLYLPAWRPGRYELGNFSKNIRNWNVFDKKGKQLSFSKKTKDCWEIKTEGNKEIIVKYQYFANILNAGACWLDETQVYVNGIHCLMYLKQRINEPCELKLKIPASWKIACGLPEISKHTLLANNYHELVDCPFIASATLQHMRYEVNKISFHIWFQGICNPDRERILSDFKMFTKEQLKLFKSFPVKSYHFLIQVLPFPYYHGVEHTNSTVLALGPGYNLMTDDLYPELLGVACHELFHTWNIKTIRPATMLSYDYQKENYSELGYIYEGVTTYYGDYLLGRCGVYSDEEFLSEMSKRLQNHMDNAGRFNYSVSQSSFDTWLDGYVPGIPGRKTSIYDEGCLLALILDLRIRKDTGNVKSLDDFMRMLNHDFGLLKKGYTEADLLNLLKKLTGKSYHDFFANYVNNAVTYDKELQNMLSYVGCGIIKKDANQTFEYHFGFKIIQERNITKVHKIYPGSVSEIAGLFLDDEIIGINKIQVENNLDQWFRFFENEIIILDVVTNKQFKKITLKKNKEKYYSRYQLVKLEKAGKMERNNFEKWMGR